MNIKMENNSLIRGLVGGLILGVLGAFIFQLALIGTGYIFGILTIIVGGMAGYGFGIASSEKDPFTSYVMGGALGYFSVLLSYILAYFSTVSGHEAVYGSYSFVPAEIFGFWEFMALDISSNAINLIFIVFGVIAGAKAAAYANKRK